MNEIETIQKITEAVRMSHTNVAPEYKEYSTLALGIASSCGEEGRAYFHELCSHSPKYRQAEADKFYTYCLQKGDGSIGMGSVVYLVRQAGCSLESVFSKEEKLSFLSSFSGSSHTPARTNRCAPQHTPAQNTVEQGFENDEEGPDIPLPTFPDLPCPPFIQQMLAGACTPQQRDTMLLSITTVLGVTLNWLTYTHYGNRRTYPNLLHMTLGTPASGKGAVSFIKQLAMPFHEAFGERYDMEMKQYNEAKLAWDNLGRKKKIQDMPKLPSRRLFIIPGNNSATGIKDNLITAEGVGLVFETEIDTIGSAISTDYGHFGDTLRKGYDNDEISFYRRTEQEYKQTRRSCFSLCLTGTIGQVFSIIPTAEDGLQSRFLFYVFPEIAVWMNQFSHEKVDYSTQFYEWGKQWKAVLDAVRQVASSFELELNDDQITRFNAHFAQVFGRASVVHGGPMKSAVARLGLNLCRMMCIWGTVRALESLLPVNGQTLDEVLPDDPKEVRKKLLASPYLRPAGHLSQENLHDGAFSTYTLHISDEDFGHLLQLAEPLYLHSSYVYALLPKPQRLRSATNKKKLFDLLPLRFTREQAIQAGKQLGLSESGVDSMLRRSVQKGILVKEERGFYTFRKEVGENGKPMDGQKK